MRWATARIIKTGEFAIGVVIPFEMNAPKGFIYFSNVKPTVSCKEPKQP